MTAAGEVGIHEIGLKVMSTGAGARRDDRGRTSEAKCRPRPVSRGSGRRSWITNRPSFLNIETGVGVTGAARQGDVFKLMLSRDLN